MCALYSLNTNSFYPYPIPYNRKAVLTYVFPSVSFLSIVKTRVLTVQRGRPLPQASFGFLVLAKMTLIVSPPEGLRKVCRRAMRVYLSSKLRTSSVLAMLKTDITSFERVGEQEREREKEGEGRGKRRGFDETLISPPLLSFPPAKMSRPSI